jgi:hypothetical protein
MDKVKKTHNNAYAIYSIQKCYICVANYIPYLHKNFLHLSEKVLQKLRTSICGNNACKSGYISCYGAFTKSLHLLGTINTRVITGSRSSTTFTM